MSDRKEYVMGKPLYGGDVETTDGTWRIPFAIPGERVATVGDEIDLIEQSPERVRASCRHFGKCGGCQYQMASYDEQVRMKHFILRDLLKSSKFESLPEIFGVVTGEPWGYRNRVRFRVERVDGEMRFGYNERGTTTFLPIAECPISAPNLWNTAETILRVGVLDQDTQEWLSAATEIELSANDSLEKTQLTFSCPPRTKFRQGSFSRMMGAITFEAPEVVGAGAIAVDPKTGPTGKVFDTWGADGLSYRVLDESYWVSRGGFFQVNRFLVPELVSLVTETRNGSVAWDLFAGVGLFSRVLARNFHKVTAVESNLTAVKDLAAALKKLGPQHRTFAATTLDFLMAASMDRERPDLVVLDPPRAGAGIQACLLIAKLEPSEIVYVSCDPTTLARDLFALAPTYDIASVHMVDLFPQTSHVETVVVLKRKS